MIFNKRGLSLVAISALAVLGTASAAVFAQDQPNAPGAGNIGAPDGTGQGFGRRGRGGFGGGAGGGGEWQQRGPHFPDARQVLSLQSLNEKQRSQIQQIYDASKAKFEPIREQMKALRQNGQGGGAQGAPDPAQREKFMAMRAQAREARQQTWTDVKKLLTDAQVKELESMPPQEGGRFGGQGFGGQGGQFGGGDGPGAGFRRGAGRQQLGGGSQGAGQPGGFGQFFKGGNQPPQQ